MAQVANTSSADTTGKSTGKGPSQIISIGAISAAIFENERQGENGSFVSNSVVLHKSYKSTEGWQHTSSLKVDDLPKAILALQKAYETLVIRKPESGE